MQKSFNILNSSFILYKKANKMLGIYKTRRIYRTMLLFSLLAAITFSSRAQDTVMVNGIVYSNTNQPIANVSVSIAGSLELPVVTNDAGEFTVLSTSGKDWLIISSTGDYKAKRVFLNDRQQLAIFLSPIDISSGDDQLSILSRSILRRNMAAAYSSIDMKDIYHTPALTIDQYMQGRVSGLNVVNRSGNPGSGAYIALRGINSLNATNQPLFVIDGIPVTPTGIFGSLVEGYAFNPLTELNPFDISKTTIIKDPAITASYGSKASNGLILIETLDPSVTQTTIELDLRTGLSLSPSNLIPQLNADQHKTLMQEVLYTSGQIEEIIQAMYPGLFYTEEDPGYIDYQHNTNWQKEIFRNSSFSNMNINVKGGDEIASYGLSFGLMDNNGIIKNTNFNGYNLRFVSRLNVFSWLKMNAGVSLNYNKSKLKEAATQEQTSPILAGLAKSPLLNPYRYDEQGKEISALSEVDAIGISNPVAIITNYEAKNANASFIASMGMDASLTRNLLLKSKFNLSYNVLKEQIFMPNHGMEHYYNNEAINIAKVANNEMRSFYNNTYLNYSKKLGENHNISSMTGFNIQTNQFEYDWALTKNAHANDQYRSIGNGKENLRENGGQNRNWNWFSLYENLFYTYKDKYLVSASLSFDGSSRVGKNAANTMKLGGVPFGLFYSAGIAWRLSSEPFLKSKSWLEDLKWRLSFGKTGNDDIGESSASNYYKAVKFRETVGLYPAVIANDKLTYENVSQINTGVDLSLWGNRFTATVDVFRSQTKNMLIFSPVDAYLGYDFRMENSGKMKNMGWEFSAFARIKESGVFKWDVQLNLSHVRNEVIDIKGSKLVTGLVGAEIVNMEGSPANSFYGYIFKGVYASDDDNSNNLVNDKFVKYGGGDAIYEDLSGPNGLPDGVINNYDKTSIGNALPDYIGGIVNAFTYKRFTLSAMIQFISGNDIFNYLRYKNEQMTGLENQSQNVLNRWQYEGQITDVPRALWEDPMGNTAFSTRWVADGSYMRVKNISLSYKIPDKILVFRYAEIYLSANNAFTFSKYLGYDPEFSMSYSPVQQGIDYGMTPQPRQFIAGVKIGL
jgi:TonB-linked SusC/RagA family outer membrane protein